MRCLGMFVLRRDENGVARGWRVERVITDIADNETRLFSELKTLVMV